MKNILETMSFITRFLPSYSIFKACALPALVGGTLFGVLCLIDSLAKERIYWIRQDLQNLPQEKGSDEKSVPESLFPAIFKAFEKQAEGQVPEAVPPKEVPEEKTESQVLETIPPEEVPEEKTVTVYLGEEDKKALTAYKAEVDSLRKARKSISRPLLLLATASFLSTGYVCASFLASKLSSNEPSTPLFPALFSTLGWIATLKLFFNSETIYDKIQNHSLLDKGTQVSLFESLSSAFSNKKPENPFAAQLQVHLTSEEVKILNRYTQIEKNLESSIESTKKFALRAKVGAIAVAALAILPTALRASRDQ